MGHSFWLCPFLAAAVGTVEKAAHDLFSFVALPREQCRCVMFNKNMFMPSCQCAVQWWLFFVVYSLLQYTAYMYAQRIFYALWLSAFQGMHRDAPRWST